jgi:pimeloyl-ACP methyl ester carboxylesterase
VSRASAFAEGTHPDRGFASVFVTAPDGLRLHIRSYGSSVASALPVVCLPALARTAADFHPLAAALAADPAKPRLVLALDYRGHGQSTYDRNPNNYTIRVALADLSAVEFPEYVDGTAEEAKNTVCWVSLSEEDLPFGEVRASHCGPLNRQ